MEGDATKSKWSNGITSRMEGRIQTRDVHTLIQTDPWRKGLKEVTWQRNGGDGNRLDTSVCVRRKDDDPGRSTRSHQATKVRPIEDAAITLERVSDRA
jgi:hypothetical protein